MAGTRSQTPPGQERKGTRIVEVAVEPESALLVGAPTTPEI